MSTSPSAQTTPRPGTEASPHEAARALTRRFGLPKGGQAERFAAAQVQICRKRPDLYPYVYPIQNHVREGTAPPNPPSSSKALRAVKGAIKRMGGRPLRAVNDHLPRPTYTADVLLCPTWVWERPQEIRLHIDLLTGLLKTGRSVLVLLRRGSTTAERMHEEAAALGAADQVTLLDPRGRLGRIQDRLHLDGTAGRARTDTQAVLDALRPAGLTLSADAYDMMAWTARCRQMWERWRPHLRFDAAVVRCHWLPLCSSVALTARERGVPVTTLQQGVVSHTMDVPVMADQYVCFGDASAGTLRSLDADVAEATGQPVQCTNYVPTGSLIDPIENPEPAFEAGTLLVIGQFTDWATDYYGLHDQKAALFSLLRRLLTDTETVAKVVVRPHPAASDAKTWEPLRTDFPQQVVFSDAHERPISYDFRRASAVLGLFSGALATAAAWGRPTFFLSDPNGFHTPDLAPFSGQSAPAASLVDRVRSTLENRSTYHREAHQAYEAASDYYCDGKSASFSPSFVDALMNSQLSTASHSQS